MLKTYSFFSSNYILKINPSKVVNLSMRIGFKQRLERGYLVFMKKIELSKNSKNPLVKGKYFAQVDDEDYEWLNQWKWCVKKKQRNLYAERTERSNGMEKTISMHRQILKITDPKIFCDHKDRNGLNNQKFNIRIATNTQNMMNRRKTENKTSKFIGVNYCLHNQRRLNALGEERVYRKAVWRAKIVVNGRAIALGEYNTEIEAAIARNEAAIKYFGEFANLNEIPKNHKVLAPQTQTEKQFLCPKKGLLECQKERLVIMYKEGHKAAHLARTFSISPASVCDILKRKLNYKPISRKTLNNPKLCPY